MRSLTPVLGVTVTANETKPLQNKTQLSNTHFIAYTSRFSFLGFLSTFKPSLLTMHAYLGSSYLNSPDFAIIS